jgi:pantoate--beta-alanine ligase
MARDLDFGVEVVGVPVVREADGLALSSRNLRLSAEDRRQAAGVYAALRAARKKARGGEKRAAGRGGLVEATAERIEAAGGRVDYVECVDKTSLRSLQVLEDPADALLAVAASYGAVRLIDNISLG